MLVVEIARQSLTRVHPGRGASRLSRSWAAGPMARPWGPDGKVYVVNNGGAFTFPERWQEEGKLGLPERYDGGYIQRVDLATGAVERLYGPVRRAALNAPNDIVFDAMAVFWFTCFGFTDGEKPAAGRHLLREGRRQRDHPAGRHEQISPNGIGLSPDGKTLYWRISMLQRLWAVNLTAPGVPEDGAGHMARAGGGQSPGMPMVRQPRARRGRQGLCGDAVPMAASR